MQKALFIGHTFHQKTKSSAFLLDLLREQYDITEYYMNPYETYEYSGFKRFSGMSFDVLVVWQIMPDISKLRKKLTWKHSIFFPMYDQYVAMKGLASSLWNEYRDFMVICFSKTMQQELADNGFDTRYIQYFPAPFDVKDWGNEQSVFFWQRLSFLNLDTLADAAKALSIQKIHLHHALDPGHEAQPLSSLCDKTAAFLKGISFTDTSWFDDKSELAAKMEESALYMAPRPYEGIGMSFLEAMALGRCVVAPDTATMNEYITDGVNGLLYPWHPDSPSHCGASVKSPGTSIRDLQKNAYRSVAEGHARWNAEKRNILEWIKQEARPNKEKQAWCALIHAWKKCPLNVLPKETIEKVRFYKPELSYTLRCMVRGQFKELYHFLLIHLNSRFMRTWYHLMNEDVAASGLPAAAHYLHQGWKEYRDPSPLFSTAHYLQNNPDVGDLDMCPLLHWKLIGRKEKRSL